MLIGKYIPVIFHSLFAIRSLRGTCSSIEMVKGYMARESLITLVQNLVPSPWWSFGGLSPKAKLQTPQIETL